MVPEIAIFLFLLTFSGGLAAAVWFLVMRLAPGSRQVRLRQWLISWSIKGLGIPTALWMVMNLGISWSLQPFMPQIQLAQSRAQSWVPDFLEVVGIGAFIVSTYWAAVTLGWTVLNAGRGVEGEARKDFMALCRACFLGLIVPALLLLLLGGLPAMGLAATLILGCMAGYTPGLIRPKKMPPMYARAIARMKFGKYNEAELEIIRELEKSEDDFEGWMMLGELYAHHFNDLSEAEQVVLDLTEQPTVTPSQLAMALHRLADWHLKLGHDPDGARRALRRVCERLKGTHLARMAQLRLDQLPATAEELREEQAARPIPLPALGDILDQEPTPVAPKADENAAARAANACVERLRRDPNNIPAREKLARIFAERLNRADLAIDQLNLLLDVPAQPEGKRAEWLGLIAAWHIRYRHDPEAGRNYLHRLVREFPESAQAFAARRRLALLNAPGQSPQSKAPSGTDSKLN